MNRDTFKKESRGRVVYLLSPSAPPESVKLLPMRWHGLKCPPYTPPPTEPPPTPAGAAAPPPPPPPAGAGAKVEAPKPAEKPPAAGKKPEKAPEPRPQAMVYVNRPPPPEPVPKPPAGGVTEQWPTTVLPVVRQAPSAETVLRTTRVLPVVRREDTERLPMAHVLPMKGAPQGSGNGTGDGTGQGPKKTLVDKLAAELAYAGAIANLQFNEDTRRPDGKPYGIVGGKSADGRIRKPTLNIRIGSRPSSRISSRASDSLLSCDKGHS